MKTALRVFGLTLTIVAAVYSSASAQAGVCYYQCPGESGFRSSNGALYDECCSGTWVAYACPGGTQGTPYVFDDGEIQMCP